MYKGVLHTYKTLSEELGIPVRVLRQRIYKHGVHKDDLSIDVNGNYEPSNCRWANDTEQQYNKRNNIRYKIRDKLLTNAEVMEILGISWDCLRRIRRQYDIHVIEMLLEDKLK